MKDHLWAWFQRALNKLEQLPFIGTIPSRSRRQVVIGSLISALFLFIVCAFIGARNRGLLGALVGALSGAILGLFLGLLVGKLYTRKLSTPRDSGKLEIQLDQSSSRYLLGDTVSGQVRLLSYMPLHSKGGNISLTCQGTFSHAPVQDAGQGAKLERDITQIYTLEAEVIPPGDLRRGSIQGFAFNLYLPQLGLPTHHGYICIISWTLHAFLSLENDQPLEVSQELLVESQPVAIPQETEVLQPSFSTSSEMSLDIPRAVYAEGETVRGQVHIKPYEQLKAKEIRVVLLRVENTLWGDNRTIYIPEWDATKGVFRAHRSPGGDGTTYVWLEGEDYLAGETILRPSEPASYPFAVEIRREWHPSIQAEQGSVTWRLVATLVCEDEPEQHVSQDLYIHTCVPKVSQLTTLT
ncbi:MAG: vacuolar protein sorting-associated family 26 protein [Anaerolineae bacterium]